jgi:chorismate dehydratase
MIGDPALRASLDRSRLPAGVEYNFDLAAEWRRETGTPFTFAVWIARPGARLGALPRLLIEARDRGLPRRAEIAARAARETGLPQAALEHYLVDVCSYDLDFTGVKEGLRLFGHHAAGLGLVERERDLEFYPI